MRESFKQFTELCTRPLADDPTLRMEIGRELENHLEDACEEELADGRAESEAEAEENAKKRFGEPEELAGSLLDANFSRLKLRARIRSIIKIALVPAILIGLLCCLDLRTLSGLILLNTLGNGPRLLAPGSVHEKIFHSVIDGDMDNLNEKEKNWVWSYFTPWSSEGWREMEKARYESRPDSKMFTADYALALVNPEQKQDEATRAELSKLIAHGRRIDPDNALYDYLEAAEAIADGVSFQKTKDSRTPGKTLWRPVLKDRTALERGMKIYLAGLQKPFVDSRVMDIRNTISLRLSRKDDFLSLMENTMLNESTKLAYSKLSFLDLVGKMNRNCILYGETLAQEGKTEEARVYLESWRKFIPQMLEHNSDSLLEVTIYYGFINDYLASAQKLGNHTEAEKLARINQIVTKWRKQRDPNRKNYLKYAGLLSSIQLPVLGKEVAIDNLAPERKLSYLSGDLVGLGALGLWKTWNILFLAVMVLFYFLAGRRPFLLLLPWKSYRRILIWGILVPIAVYLTYTNIDALGGRNLSIPINLGRFGLGLFALVFIFPMIYESLFLRELKKQATVLGFPKGKLPVTTRYFNLLCAMAAFLLIAGGILRPLLATECRRALEEDTIFSTQYDSCKPEMDDIAMLAGRLRLAIDSTDYAENSAKN